MKTKDSDYCDTCGEEFQYAWEGYEVDFKKPDENRGCLECGIEVYTNENPNHYPWRLCDSCHKTVREEFNKNWIEKGRPE